MSNYSSPDAKDRSGPPSPTTSPTGNPGSFSPVAPPAKGRGVPSRDATLALLVKDKRFAAYRGGALGTIKQLAKRWSVDAVELLLVLAATGRPATATAIDAIGPKFRTRNESVTLEDWARNSGIQLRFAPSQVLGEKLKKAGFQPYVPSPGQTPGQTAVKGVETTVARGELTDPYVMIDGKGRLRPTKNPNEAIKSFNAPIRQSDYLRAESHWNDYFTRYIGRKAKPGEVVGIINKGLSPYAVQTMLSKSPQFKRGLVWQSAAPSIVGYAKSLFGEGWKVDREFVRRAIVQSWSEGTLRRKLVERPEYLKGPEFRQNVASLMNVHQTIFGRPDEKQMVGIRESALGGWSTDQYAAYLRSSPDYVKSSEYQAKALNFLDALGLITGQQPTSQDVGMLGQPNNPNISGPLPNSPRIPGNEPPGIGAGLAAGIQKVGQAVGGKKKSGLTVRTT